MVAFILCDETAVELTFNLVDELLRIGNYDLFLRRDDDVGNGDRHTGDAGIVIAEVFDIVDDFRSLRRTEVVIAVGNKFSKFLLVHEDAECPLTGFLILMIVTKLFRQNLIEDHTTKRGLDDSIPLNAAANLCLDVQIVLLISEKRFGNARDDIALSQCSRLNLRQIVGAKNHVLRRNNDRLAVFRCQNVVGCEHEDACFRLRLGRKREMNRHLVTVKVRIVCRTSERMKF